MQKTISTTGRGLIALAALGLVGGTGVVWAQKATTPRGYPAPQRERLVTVSTSDVLKGLRGVALRVEELPDDAKKIGLTQDRIQSAVELSLRRNGVPVLTKKEVLEKPGKPHLFVGVNVIGRGFSIILEVNEYVHLERDPKTIVAGATIWTKGYTGEIFGAGSTSGDYIVRQVGATIDGFCLDYLKVNPK